MKKYFFTYGLTFFLLLLNTYSNGQTIVMKQSSFYETGKFHITKKNASELNRIIDSIKINKSFTIQLEGNTDNVGNDDYNKSLSEKRANEVKLLMKKAGIPDELITVKAFGSENPISSNKSRSGRKQNRRVDIIVLKNEDEIKAPVQVPNIAELFKQIVTGPDTFCINRNLDTVVRCKKGTVIYIKANSLLPKENCGSNCITFIVREDFFKSEMLLDNLSTTSNGEIIETQGMISTEAIDCKGNKLELENGKDLVILLPTESINPTAKIFDGNRNHDSVMNWTASSNSILSNFSQKDFYKCLGGDYGIPDEIPCKFFFCKIRRFTNRVLSTVNPKNIFKQKQKQTNTTNETLDDLPSVMLRPDFKMPDIPICIELEDLFLKYGVRNINQLLLAINKPLLDSYKVQTMEQLRDTLAKVNTQNILLAYMNKKVSFNDFKYYVYNNPKLGFSNIDCFANIPEDKKTSLKINLTPAVNIDCKLVFKNRNIVIPAIREGNEYKFKGVPDGEEAFIVVIKYLDFKPFLAIKKITVENKTFDIEFNELTIEELKEKLKQLN